MIPFIRFVYIKLVLRPYPGASSNLLLILGELIFFNLETQWTRVKLNSNRTDPCAGLGSLSCAASTGPILSYAGSVSTLMARPEFLQYPAYHRPILPTPLVQFSVILFGVVYFTWSTSLPFKKDEPGTLFLFVYLPFKKDQPGTLFLFIYLPFKKDEPGNLFLFVYLPFKKDQPGTLFVYFVCFLVE